MRHPLLGYRRHVIATLVVIAGVATVPFWWTARSEPSGSAAPPVPVAAPAPASEAADPENAGPAEPAHPPAYAYYYLWWSTAHWQDKLGPAYPFDADPPPLPASLDADGCNPRSSYEGNTLFDVPARLDSQDDPGVIEADVRQAAAAGLAGFIVNWKGEGRADQSTADNRYSRRLAEVLRAVAEVNAEGAHFRVVLNYAGSQEPDVEQMIGDWTYLEREVATRSALERRWSPRPLLIWNSTGSYPTETLRRLSERFRSTFFIVGSESWTTWTTERGVHLDGNTYYWSSQNPYTNASSFEQLAGLAATVRASGANPDGTPKLWLAPLAPGYNHLLDGGETCVPRNDGQTMRKLFEGNRASDPDGWALISWNEITEGTFVEPLQRWGSRYLDVLADVFGAR